MLKVVILITSFGVAFQQEYDISLRHGPFELMSGPAHWSASQFEMVKLIVSETRCDQHPHLMVAIAEVESSFDAKSINWKTRDVGLFQINYRWHGKQLNTKTYEEFKIIMLDPEKNTRYALQVVKDMRRYRGCQRGDLPACYNGGPGWRISKNRLKIQAYRDKVNQLARRYEKNSPGWKKQCPGK